MSRMVMSEPACLAPARRRGGPSARIIEHQQTLRAEEPSGHAPSPYPSFSGEVDLVAGWESPELAAHFSASPWNALKGNLSRKMGFASTRQPDAAITGPSAASKPTIAPPEVQTTDIGCAGRSGSEAPIASVKRPVLIDSADGDELSYMLSGGSCARRARLACTDRSPASSSSSSLSGSSSYIASSSRRASDSPTSVLRPTPQHAPSKPQHQEAPRLLPSRAASLPTVEPVTSVASALAAATRATVQAAADSNSALRKALSSPLERCGLAKLKVKQE